MFKFLHLADIHLGCRRYGLEERTRDFYRAWHDVITRHAIPEKVEFVLIAGDFFDMRKVDPQAMNHAMHGLVTLKDAGIPVVAIEGNHDQHDAISSFSWLRSLSAWGYLKLLEPSRDDEGRMTLVPWDEEMGEGSYIDIGGARIFGSHWYGASAAAAMPVLSDALRRAREEGRFNILLLHAEIEEHAKRPMASLSVASLRELRPLVDYVALGHTHKRFEIDNWAFNPGSLEACKIDEYREERGAFLVEVGDDGRVDARHVRDYVRRPFQRLQFDVSGAENAGDVHTGIIETVRREARRHEEARNPARPIIEITLKGHLGFKASELKLNQMRDEVKQLTSALHVILRNATVPKEYAVAANLDPHASRDDRERRIIEDLIMRHDRFKHRAHEMAELVIESKRLALSNESPEKILELIARKLETSDAELCAGAGDRAAEPSPAALQAIERSAAVS